MSIPDEAEKRYPASKDYWTGWVDAARNLAFIEGAEWARKEALREAAEAVRANAGTEDEYGICEGVSGWPLDAARTYSHATYEAIEAIRALAEGDR